MIYLVTLSGRLRFIYADSDYALVAKCNAVDDDGACMPGYDSTVVFSRTRDLPGDAIARMIPHPKVYVTSNLLTCSCNTTNAVIVVPTIK